MWLLLKWAEYATRVASRSLADLLAAVRKQLSPDLHQDVVLRFTAVLLLLHGATSEYAQVPVRILCGLMLAFPPTVRVPLLWWLLVVVLAATNVAEWSAIDNHKFLITYWTLACALSFMDASPEDALRTTARLLVGLAFGFAAVWKVLGGGYLDGSFFDFTLFTDSRLTRVAASIAGLRYSDVFAIGEAYRFMGSHASAGASIAIPDSAPLRLFAMTLSWTGLAIETAVGTVHLLGASGRLYAYRHSCLILFIASTYFLLPVMAFATTLAVLGFAQCRSADEDLKIGYLVLLAWMHLAMIPWQRLLLPSV